MKKLFAFILTATALTGCAKFPDGTSVWAEGLWIIPVLLLTGIVIFGYKAYASSKSNSTQNSRDGGFKDNTGNVPVTKSGYFYFAIACVLALIVVVIVVNSSK